jgi:hypothetical protein
VSHHERLIEVWRRTDEGWTGESVRSGDVVTLSSIGCTLEVAAVYDAAIEPIE